MVALTEQIIRGKTRIDKLDDVKNLNLWGQDLDDVSVLAKMPNVEVLSLSVNRISTLKGFRHCLKLQELYLRKNVVQDVTDLQYLSQLTSLRVLWLCDNPCADHPFYRQLVARMVPSVDKLDNMEISASEKEAALLNPDLGRYLSPELRQRPTSPSLRAAATQQQQQQQQQAYADAQPDPPQQAPQQASQAREGRGGAGPDAARRRKNVLYAVMALVAELDEDDLVYVKREIEQRLGALGR
ncbi:hypothetical protein V8C86DRAFT_2600705 [Haematococcus lacustris]